MQYPKTAFSCISSRYSMVLRCRSSGPVHPLPKAFYTLLAFGTCTSFATAICSLAHLTLLLLVFRKLCLISSPALSFQKSIYPQGSHSARAGSLLSLLLHSSLDFISCSSRHSDFQLFHSNSFDFKLSPTLLNMSGSVLGHVIYCTSWTILNSLEKSAHQEFLEVNSKLLLFKPVRVTLSSSSVLSWEP